MNHRATLTTAVLLALNLCVPPCSAEEIQGVAAETTGAERYQRYLDAVRAQRRIYMEERAKTMREAAENRRRLLDPWGENHRQAMENRSKQHHDDLLERRRRSSLENDFLVEQQEQQHQGLQTQAEAQRQQMETYREQWLTPRQSIPRYWDNPWYYQGY
jgi:hypothetical protein